MPFAALKPAHRIQKNKDQNKDTEDIPLPGVPGIVPKERFSDCSQQIAHVLALPPQSLATPTPTKAHEHGSILPCEKHRVNLIVTSERSPLVPQCDRRAFALFVGTLLQPRGCE